MYLTRNILNIQGKFVPVLVGVCTNCEQSGVQSKSPPDTETFALLVHSVQCNRYLKRLNPI